MRRCPEDELTETEATPRTTLAGPGAARAAETRRKHKERARQRRRRHAPWERSALQSRSRPR